MIVRNPGWVMRGWLHTILISMALVAMLGVSSGVSQEAPAPLELPPLEPSPSLLAPPRAPREQLLAPVPSQFDWIYRDVRPNRRLEALLEGQPLLELFMSVSLTEMYSDNVDQEDEDPREEFLTELTFGTTYRLQNPRNFVSLANTLSVNHEHRAEVTNIGFANLALNAVYNLSRLTLGLSETFIIDDDLEAASTAGTRRERSRFLRNSVIPQLRYALDRAG